MASQDSPGDGGVSRALPKLFLQGWEARRKLDACELSSGSPEHSRCVSDGVAALEKATEMASHVSLFSDNEDLEEVTTPTLKYLLLPALLGELTLQQTEGDRIDIIHRARVYFVDYLKRCRSYGITKDDPPPLVPPAPLVDPSVPPTGGRMSQLPPKKTYNQMAAERAAKIQKLREKKELEQRTGELTVALNEGRRCRYDNDDKDDEIGREKWVALLQLSVYKSQEFVNSIDNEIPILRHMESIKKGEVPVAKKPEGASGCGPVQESPRQPVKPLVITREMLRGEVFGAGYPSLPTMTVEEFYQQKYDKEKSNGGNEGRKEIDGEEKGSGSEKEEEEDSEEALKKAREWDDFKDENRRGWGNKKNMG